MRWVANMSTYFIGMMIAHLFPVPSPAMPMNPFAAMFQAHTLDIVSVRYSCSPAVFSWCRFSA